MWGVECPGQNFVYADVDGTIGYQCTGRFPLRNAGDGTAPVPGWTAGHEWDGWIPFDELPWAVDPPHRIPGHREQPDPRRRLSAPDRARLPHAVPSAPSRRAAGGGRPCTTSPRWRGSNRTPSRSPRRPRSLGWLALEPRSDEERHAIALLAGWDGDMSAFSPSAAGVFNVWSRHIARRALASAARRRAVPPLPRGPRDLPMRGPAGVAARSGRLDRRRAAARGAGRRARRTPGATGSGSVGVAMGRAAPTRAGPSARLDPGSWSRCSRPRDDELGGDEQTVVQGGFDGRDGYHGDRDRVVARRLRPGRPRSVDRRAARRRVGQPGLAALERPVPVVDRRGAPPVAVHDGRPWKPPRSPRCACSPGNIGAMPKSRSRNSAAQKRRYQLEPERRRRRSRSRARAGTPPLVLGLMGLGVVMIILNYIWPAVLPFTNDADEPGGPLVGLAHDRRGLPGNDQDPLTPGSESHRCDPSTCFPQLWETPAGRMWITGGYPVRRPWKTAQPTAGRRHHLHRLAAMARDLQLAQAGDVELGPALVADQEHVELLDVLDLAASCGRTRSPRPNGTSRSPPARSGTRATTPRRRGTICCSGGHAAT